MAYFVSRDGIDVKNLGPAAVESLIVSGSLGSYSSLFHLSESDFYSAGIGEAMTDKIMASIERCKKLPFKKVLRAVGIPEIGDSTARDLAQFYPSFDALFKAEAADLQRIPGVGPAVVESIGQLDLAQMHDFLALDKILTYEAEKFQMAEVQDLAGKTVVVSGSDFAGKTRKEMETDVISRGAKLSKSVSKKTDILFAGIGAGPDKVKTVKELGFVAVDDIKWVNPNALTRIEPL
ncbi:DNA ligase [compost metagenome]